MRTEQYNEIGGVKYVCHQLPGWDGVGLFFELTQLIGEPAMVMITRAFSESEVKDLDAGEIVGSGIYTFLAKLSAPTGIRIMKIVFAGVRATDEKGNAHDMGVDSKFDDHFKGETMRALKVFAWALQVNFQSFLDDGRLSGPLGAAKKAFAKAFSPPTSTPASQPSASRPTEASTSGTSP